MQNLILESLILFAIILQSNGNDIQTNYNKQPIFKQGFCANQQMLQSPINIAAPFTFMKFSIKFNFYELGTGEVINNGNYLALFGDFGNFEYQNSVFNIYEIQFKSPSEHSVGANQQEFPLEIQFISTNSEKMFINIAVLFSLEENAEDNQFLSSIGFGNGILAHLKQNSSLQFNKPISLGNILPFRDQFFIYQGSQTTPNCQPTIWFITYDSQILNSDQLKDFPQNLIFHQRKRSEQGRPIFITFYEEEAIAQYEEQQEKEKVPEKSGNQTESADNEKKKEKKQPLSDSSERLEDFQPTEIPQEKLDLLGTTDDIYESDFYAGTAGTTGKELSQQNTLLVVSKNEYVNYNVDASRVILSDESLDSIIDNLDNQAQEHSPFQQEQQQISEDADDYQQQPHTDDIIESSIIENAVDSQAKDQLQNSFELDTQQDEDSIQLEADNPVVYEFQSPEIKQIKNNVFKVARKSPKSNDDILSLDAPTENTPEDLQQMSFLQMKNKFLRKKKNGKQQQLQEEIPSAKQLCLGGKEQSPINIYPDEQFYCEPCSLKVNFYEKMYEKFMRLQNDPIRQCLRLYGGSFGQVSYGEHNFEIQEIFIKSPSEHTFGKKTNTMDMELQILCQDKYGLKIIISTFFQSLGEEYDEPNQFLETIQIHSDPTESVYIPEGKEIAVSTEQLSLNLLFDEIANFLSYDGSLTYSPCTEGVRWFLLRERKSVIYLLCVMFFTSDH